MKKVIEKLNRVLSMLLVAALVVGSVPEMSLVARAEEESTVDESTTEPESTTVPEATEPETTTVSETTEPETTEAETTEPDTTTESTEPTDDEQKSESDEGTNDGIDGQADEGGDGVDEGNPTPAPKDSLLTFMSRAEALAIWNKEVYEEYGKETSGSWHGAPENITVMDQSTLVCGDITDVTGKNWSRTATYTMRGTVPYQEWPGFDNSGPLSKGHYVFFIIKRPEIQGVADNETVVWITRGSGAVVDHNWKWCEEGIAMPLYVGGGRGIVDVDWDGNGSNYSRVRYEFDTSKLVLENAANSTNDVVTFEDLTREELDKAADGFAENTYKNFKDKIIPLNFSKDGDVLKANAATVPYLIGWYEINKGKVDEQEGHYVAFKIKIDPNKLTGKEATSKIVAMPGDTAYKGYKVEQFDNGELILIKHIPKSKQDGGYKIYVNLAGFTDASLNGGKPVGNSGETIEYTLDFSNVTFEKGKSEVEPASINETKTWYGENGGFTGNPENLIILKENGAGLFEATGEVYDKDGATKDNLAYETGWGAFAGEEQNGYFVSYAIKTPAAMVKNNKNALRPSVGSNQLAIGGNGGLKPAGMDYEGNILTMRLTPELSPTKLYVNWGGFEITADGKNVETENGKPVALATSAYETTEYTIDFSKLRGKIKKELLTFKEWDNNEGAAITSGIKYVENVGDTKKDFTTTTKLAYGKYYFFITPGTGKVIEKVTNNETTPESYETVDVNGETAYKILVTGNGSQTIRVYEKTPNKKLTLVVDEHVKSVSYYYDGNTGKYTTVALKTETSGTKSGEISTIDNVNVTVKVTYEDGYTCDKFKTDANDNGSDSDVDTTSIGSLMTSIHEVTVANPAVDQYLGITSKRLTNRIKFSKVEGAKITIRGLRSAGAKVVDSDPSVRGSYSNDAAIVDFKETGEDVFKTVTFEVPEGNALSFEVESTNVAGKEVITGVQYKSGKTDGANDIQVLTNVDIGDDGTYEIKSTRGNWTNAWIEVEVGTGTYGGSNVTVTNGEATFDANGTTYTGVASQATSIQKVNYGITNGQTDTTKIEDDRTGGTADGATSANGAQASYTTASGKPFMFTVQTNTGYVVEKVTWGTTDKTENTISPMTVGDKTVYKIDKMPGAALIDITTKLDTSDSNTNVHKKTFTWTDKNIVSVVAGDLIVADVTSRANNAVKYAGAFPIKSGETVYSVDGSYNLVVTVKDGYKLTNAQTEVGTPNSSNVYTFAVPNASYSFETEVVGKTEGDSYDRYVRFSKAGVKDVTLKAEVVDEDTNYVVYKIPDGTNTAEFTVTLDYTKKLDDATKFIVTKMRGLTANDKPATGQDGLLNFSDDYSVNREKTEATYSGTLITSKLNGYVAEKKVANTYAINPDEYDTVKFVTGNARYNVKFMGGAGAKYVVEEANENKALTGVTEDEKTVNAYRGNKVVVKPASYQELYTAEKDPSEESERTKVTLDSDGEYVFQVEKDIWLYFVDKEAPSEYELKSITTKDANGVTTRPVCEKMPHTANTYKVANNTATLTAIVGFVTAKSDGSAVNGINKITVTSEGTTTAKVNSGTPTQFELTMKENAGAKVNLVINISVRGKDGITRKIDVPATIVLRSKLTDIALSGIEKNATVAMQVGEAKKAKVTLLSEAFAEENTVPVKSLVDVIVKNEKGSKEADSFAEIVGDELVINPVKKEGKYTVTVTPRDNATTKLHEFTLDVAAPEIKLVSAVSPTQGSNTALVTLTPSKTKINAVNAGTKNAEYVYYEIKVAAKGTAPSGSVDGKAFYIHVETDSDGYAKAGTYELELNKVDASKEGNNAAGNYELTSKIVTLAVNNGDTSTRGTAPNVVQIAGTAKTSGILSSSNEVVTKVSTKNLYFEDNLKVKKIDYTVVNTDKAKAVAKVEFSANSSSANYSDIEVTVKDGTGLNITGTRSEAGLNVVEPDEVNYAVGVDGTIKLTANVRPGKYTVEVSSGSATGTGFAGGVVPSKKTFVINVVQGITRIKINSDESMSSLKLKLDAKKGSSYTLKPEIIGGTWNGGTYKPAKTTLKYEILNVALSSNKDKVSVDAKTGKIKVNKDFAVGANTAKNTFDVRIKAGDCEGTGTNIVVKIEVTSSPLEIGAVKLQKWNAAARKYVDVAGDIALTGELAEAMTEGGVEQFRFVVTDTSGADAADFVSYKSSNPAAVRVDAKTGVITPLKPAKNVTFTVTPTDGGKGKAVKSEKYNFVYAATGNLRFVFIRADGGTLDGKVYGPLVEKAKNSYEYSGTVNKLFWYEVQSGGALAPAGWYNYTLSIKGGKFVRTIGEGIESGDIVPTDKTTTITLKDKANKANNQTITLVNTDWQVAKAPSAKLSNKGKVYLNATSELVYTVKNSNYTHVYIENESNPENSTLVRTENEKTAYSNQPIYEIRDNMFRLNIDGDLVGTDKYRLVYGHVTGNSESYTFVPETQASYISVKVNRMSEFKPTAKYSYDPKAGKFEFTGKPAEALISVTNVYSANVNSSKVKGRPNKFSDYFEANGKNIKERVADGKSALATAIEKNELKAEDLTGYVTYEYYNSKGVMTTKDVKITVAMGNESAEFAFDSASTLGFKDSDVSVNLFVDGVKTNIGAAWIDTAGAAKDWTITPAINPTTDVGTATLTLKAGKNFDKGSYQIPVYVLPVGHVNASKLTSKANAEKYGKLVTLNVTVEDISTYVGKLEQKKDVIDFSSEDPTSVVTTIPTACWSETVTLADYVTNKYQGRVNINSAEVTSGNAKVTLSSNKLTFDIFGNEITADSTIDVDVKFGFTGTNVASETLKFKVKTPKRIQTKDDVRADITNYLATRLQWDTAVVAGVNNVNVGSIPTDVDRYVKNDKVVKLSSLVNVTFANSSEQGTDDEKFVKVTIKDKYDKNAQAVEFDAPIPKKAAPVYNTGNATTDEANIYAAIQKNAGLIANETTYNGWESGNEAAKLKAEGGIVTSNSMTKFAVLAQLTKGWKNDNYAVNITKFEVRPSTEVKVGAVEFTYQLVAKDRKIAYNSTPAIGDNGVTASKNDDGTVTWTITIDKVD